VKAVVWHGKEDVRVDEVPDPRIEQPTDAIDRIKVVLRPGDLVNEA
jgi:threonine dehydrogenase-like Zn-dependent dehydrogenase